MSVRAGVITRGATLAKTVLTSATAYLSVAEFLKRVDLRVCADLVSDSGSRAGSSTDTAAMATALATNENLAAVLLDASGMLEEACLLGQRYEVADIAALIATAGAGRAAVYRILTRLAVCLLYERRPDREMKQPEILESALMDLQALRDGERIFPFTETQEAGRADSSTITAAELERRDGTVVQASRYFGRRGDRRPRTGTS